MRVIKNHPELCVLLLLLGGFRLGLISSGQAYWPDECHYQGGIKVLDLLQQGRLGDALGRAFDSHVRPGYTLYATIPAGLQMLLAKAGVLPADRAYCFDVACALNVCITLAISVLIYVLLLRLLQRRGSAALWTLVYSLLCSSNLYIRHLLPYDLSLLLFLTALLLASGARPPARSVHVAMLCGMLAMVAFSMYPGYYALVIVIAAALWYTDRRPLRSCAVYFATAGSLVLIAELLAQLVGRSYVLAGLRLSSMVGSVAQGSYEEGFIFLVRYLFVVEGWIGCVLIVLGAGCVLTVLVRQRSWIRPALAVVGAAYLFHAAQVVLLHRSMFYGRLMHMYIPFVVIACAVGLACVHNRRLRSALQGIVLAVSLFSFVQFARTYVPLSYPRDLEQHYLAGLDVQDISRASETSTAARTPEFNRFLAVNVEHLYPIPEAHGPVDPPGMRLVVSRPHPLTFKAYPFEGFNIAERRRISQRQYRMRIYERLQPAVTDPTGNWAASANPPIVR